MKHFMPSAVTCCVLGLAVGGGVLTPVGAMAQSTFGSVRGTASDSTGASLPGTAVVLHSDDENTETTMTSDSGGGFVFENVKPGKYTLRASHTGFSGLNMTGVQVAARQDLRVTVALTVASDQTVVEVTSSADQINTENAAIADSKDNTLMTQLPLNNRATTTSPLGSLNLSANVQQDSQGNIALGGASSSMVNFSVDGISTANVRQNGALQDAYPSQEGIAAVKVTAFNNSAEFSQVGDVTFTTKSGANRYHGSLFEYFQNSALDASPYGFDAKAPKNFNTFGGSLSGPVTIPHLYQGKDRTFFFADYEENRRTLSVNQQFFVPTAADRTGNLQDIGGPDLRGAGFAINPVATALLNYYPLPTSTVNGGANDGSVNYTHFQPTPARTDGADVRIDQTLTSKQSLYARFSRKNITSEYANPFLPNDVDSIHNRSLLVSYTYVLTPRLLNEFRYGLTNVTTAVNFAIQGSAALAQLGLQGVDISQHPLTDAFPTFNFNSGTNFTPIGRDKTGVTQSKTSQFADNVTFTLGKHTVKGGVDFRRVRYFDTELFLPSDDFGSFTFQPTFTGNAFGDFLEGTPTTTFFAVSSPDVGGQALQSSFFLQDEFQVNSRLTLSYGLRYQLLPGFTEDGGNLANYDENTNSIVVPDALAGYLQAQNLGKSNIAFQQSFNSRALPQTDPAQKAVPFTNYVTASQAGLPQSLRRTYKGNVQPRIAFAYRPFNDTKTVVRGGFGIYTMTNLGPLSFNNSGNPTSNLHTYSVATGPGITPVPKVTFPNTAPATVGAQYGGGNLDQGVDPNYRDPQSNQYNLTVERQLTSNDSLRVSLVGMNTYRLNITEDLNQIHASTTPYDSGSTAGVYVDKRAPYQNWFELYSTLNHGKATYKAVEVELAHRMSHGLYYNANYTLADNKADNQGDTPSQFAGEVNYGIPIADRFNTAADYGNVEGTRRNRFLLSGIYQLPFGAGRKYMNGGGIKDRLLGGFDLNTVTLIESGPWQTPSISAGGVNATTEVPFDQSNTNVTNRGAYLRPDVVSTDFSKGRSRAQYFNLAAFAPTPANAGRFGNAGVGILEGPGTKTASVGVAKVFRVTEGSRIRVESTFTNVFNHTNFAPPSTQVDNTQAFGKLTSATTAENAGNRTGQLAVRYEF